MLYNNSNTSACIEIARSVHSREQNFETRRHCKSVLPCAPLLAVMTLLTRKVHSGGVALGGSLRTMRRNSGIVFDMLAMCPDFSSDPVLDALGWKCVPHMHIQGITKRWRWDMTMKIVPFSQTNYSRIVLIDADLIVVDWWLFSSLFYIDIPEGNIASTRDCSVAYMQGRPGKEDEIQAGLIVLRPSTAAYTRLLAAHKNKTIVSADGGGQGFSSVFWKDKITWIPSCFNVVQSSHCMGLTERGIVPYTREELKAASVRDTHSANDHANALLKAGALAAIHFHFSPKPWALKMDCRSLKAELGNKTLWCGQKWIAGETALPTLVAAWENAFRRGLAEANLTTTREPPHRHMQT